MKEQNSGAILKSLLNQYTKTFTIFDVYSRPWKVFQAPSEAKDQSPCLLTEYVYTDVTGTTIKGTKEVEGTWLASYDTDFTV